MVTLVAVVSVTTGVPGGLGRAVAGEEGQGSVLIYLESD